MGTSRHLDRKAGAVPARAGRRLRTLLLVVAVGVLALFTSAAVPGEEATLEFYYGDGCPYCAQEEAFLDDLEVRHPDLEVERYEVWNDIEHRRRLESVMAGLGERVQGVPVTVFDGRAWTGFNDLVAAEIEHAVVTVLESGAPAGVAGPPAPTGPITIDVPLLGAVDLGDRSLVAATSLIALVDGFNPCSLWVLTVLLAMVVNAGTGRRRLAVVGLTFLAVTAAIYGVFVAGLFSAVGAVGLVHWVAVATGVLAVAYGAVNVKDY